MVHVTVSVASFKECVARAAAVSHEDAVPLASLRTLEQALAFTMKAILSHEARALVRAESALLTNPVLVALDSNQTESSDLDEFTLVEARGVNAVLRRLGALESASRVSFESVDQALWVLAAKRDSVTVTMVKRTLMNTLDQLLASPRSGPAWAISAWLQAEYLDKKARLPFANFLVQCRSEPDRPTYALELAAVHIVSSESDKDALEFEAQVVPFPEDAED